MREEAQERLPGEISNEGVPVFANSAKTQGKSVPGRESSKCKGAEVGVCSACWKTRGRWEGDNDLRCKMNAIAAGWNRWPQRERLTPLQPPRGTCPKCLFVHEGNTQ